MMQSGANQSLKGYSLLCGKKREVRDFHAHLDLTWRQQDREINCGFPENSLQFGAGKFHSGSGNSNSLILGLIRELLYRRQDRPQKAAGPNSWGASFLALA